MKVLHLITTILIIVLLSCNNNKNNKPHSKEDLAYLSQSSMRGKQIYQDLCITCHLENGKGVTEVFPPLVNSDYLKNNQAASIRGLKYGMQGKIVVNGITYNSVMAPLGLSNEEIADVMNYINTSWNNNINQIITPKMVAEIEK